MKGIVLVKFFKVIDMKAQYSEKFLRQRKMMLYLPVMVIPLICLAFYALGGGTGKAAGSMTGKKLGRLGMTNEGATVGIRGG